MYIARNLSHESRDALKLEKHTHLHIKLNISWHTGHTTQCGLPPHALVFKTISYCALSLFGVALSERSLTQHSAKAAQGAPNAE
jgi:hypothetical protein